MFQQYCTISLLNKANNSKMREISRNRWMVECWYQNFRDRNGVIQKNNSDELRADGAFFENPKGC